MKSMLLLMQGVFEYLGKSLVCAEFYEYSKDTGNYIW